MTVKPRGTCMDYSDTLPPGVAKDLGSLWKTQLPPESKQNPPKKVFAKPFRLVFKKTKTQEITGIEVSSLEGLRTITDKIAAGELTPVNSFSTLDRQLWGILAEYVGFLRYDVSHGEFGEGIQPIGAHRSQLVEEMKEFFGGLDPGLEALNAMRRQISKSLADKQPVDQCFHDNVFLKEDGVNLTEEGEAALADIVGISNTEIVADVANALTAETEPGPFDEELEVLDCSFFEPAERTGIDAELEGQRVEKMGPSEDLS
ncbi:MAG: hypothetical protein MN733_30270 [Nitrososphaera sp.]|nr:hypothetical protein [Nitrososphaera sp.]